MGYPVSSLERTVIVHIRTQKIVISLTVFFLVVLGVVFLKGSVHYIETQFEFFIIWLFLLKNFRYDDTSPLCLSQLYLILLRRMQIS